MFPDLRVVEGGRTSFITHNEVLQYLKRYAATFDLYKYIKVRLHFFLV